jgi:hypothetical protein
MADDDTIPQPEPYTCGTLAHIFEWNSAVHEQCPSAQRCLCGARSYGEALLASLRTKDH